MPPDNSNIQHLSPSLFKKGGLLVGFTTMAWLTFEDTSETGPMIISTIICIWFGLYFRLEFSKLKNLFLLDLVTGVLVGLIIPLMMIFLMIFKSGLHSHPTPDFTTQELLNLFQRIPYWGLGGALIGFGASLWGLANRS